MTDAQQAHVSSVNSARQHDGILVLIRVLSFVSTTRKKIDGVSGLHRRLGGPTSRGFKAEFGKQDLLFEGFEENSQVTETYKDGSIAFVFGRDALGRSVVVRIEGVHHRLYFLMQPEDTEESIRCELTKEVETVLSGKLKVETKQFCHYYYYEPDKASVSGRRVHYAEVSYPSLRSWRESMSHS